MLPKRNKYSQKRQANTRFPKSKTLSYRSSRRGANSDSHSNQDNTSPGSKPGGRRSKISRLLNIFIIVSILSSLVYMSHINTDPVIKLEQEAIPRNESDYYRAVINEINSSVMYKNKLTFSTTKLNESIRSQFPEINSVTVEIPVFRHRPVINLSVAKPAARLVTTDKSYILDVEGRALFSEDKINDQFNTSSLVSMNDSSGHPVTLGEPVLTGQQISYIREVIEQSRGNNVPAQSFNLEFGGSAVDVKFKDVNYIVKFSFYEDPKQSSGAYFALKEEIDSGNVSPPSQYVDLRVPDRAYIK